MAKSVKKEQSVKTNLFEALNLLRSENSKLMKVAYISEDYTQKNKKKLKGDKSRGVTTCLPL